MKPCVIFRNIHNNLINSVYNSLMLSFSEYISSQNIVASSIHSVELIDNLVESIWNLSADPNSFVFTIGNGEAPQRLSISQPI